MEYSKIFGGSLRWGLTLGSVVGGCFINTKRTRIMTILVLICLYSYDVSAMKSYERKSTVYSSPNDIPQKLWETPINFGGPRYVNHSNLPPTTDYKKSKNLKKFGNP